MTISVKPRLLFKPIKQTHSAVATIRRHLSDESLPNASSSVPQILSFLQTTDSSDWSSNTNLSTLLSSLSPHTFLKLTRKLPDYQNAIDFFNHLTTTSLQPDCLSFAFQAVLEHADRENPGQPTKLNELFGLCKQQDIPLSITAASFLMKRFGKARLLEELLLVFDSIDPESRNAHLYNLVIVWYFNCGRGEDAFKMLEEMLKPDSNCPPNSNTVDIVFSSILKKKWDGWSVGDEEVCKLVSSFAEHGVYPASFWLTQIIMKLCRSGKCDKAWDMLNMVISTGCDVGSAPCNALLTGLGKERNYVKMTLLMNEMKERGIRPNVVTIAIMINHLCKFRRVDEALQIFKQMRDGDLGIEPDVVTFNTLIGGLCKVGRQDEGLKLMERMKLEGKCKPDVVTYNCLIDGYCKAGELERGRELFDQMCEGGVERNVITLNALIDGMCKHGRVSSAMELFRDMENKGLKGNTVTYTTLMAAFSYANNIDKAMTLFDEMLGNDCSPDAVAYYTLISGLSQSGRMNDASFVVSKMKKAGLGLDIVSYNVLLNGFFRQKKLDKVHEFVKDMEQAGVKPDLVTYNTIISFFCADGNFGQAHKVMKKMINDGITPTVVTYGALIQGFCSNNNLVEAIKIFRDMSSSSKVPPNTVIYNMLIDSHCKRDDVEVALSLMDDMKFKTVKPNTTTYNAMFKGLKQRNWVEKALKFMDQMTEEACKPDYITMEILTEWFSAVGETIKLKDFVKGLRVSTSVA